MLDIINSLSKEDLVKLGKKHKILGHLSNFTDPYVSMDELRLAIIKKIEDENPEESGKTEKKRRSKRNKSSKRIHGNRKNSKKNIDLGIDLNYKYQKPKSYYKLPDGAKIAAIGDLHGDLEVCIKTLKLAGVIPLSTPHYFETLKDANNIEWIGGNTHVVQVGDQIDRCRPNNWYRDICADDSTYQDEGSDLKIMELLDKLNEKAKYQGGAIISILGNHEIMNCVGDFRYVSPKEFEEFGEFFKIKKTNNPNRVFPYGYKERKQAFSPGGMIARKFASQRNSIVQVGGWVFVHGGITPKLSNEYTLDEMNEGMSKWLLGRRDKKTKDIFEALYDDDDHGIFWTREFGDLSNWQEERSTQMFYRTLDNLNKKNDRDMDNICEGIVMGHSPQYMNMIGINSSCQDKLWRVDIGASKAFGPFTKCDEENKYRKAAILIINPGNKCKIVKEK